VAYAHQYFLLMRDLTFVTLFLIVAAALIALVTKASLDQWLTVGVMLVGEFLLAMRTAESLGIEFVRNALAEESAKP